MYRVSNAPSDISAADVVAAEQQLGFRFPAGYAEVVSTFGYGEFQATVRFTDPRRCSEETQQALTFNPVKGAWLLGYQSGAGPLWFFPHDDQIHEENDLQELSPLKGNALDVLGELLARESQPPYVFERFNGRQRWLFSGSHTCSDDHFEEVVAQLKAIGPRDHSAQWGTRGATNRSEHLYYRSFGGSVSVLLGGGGVSLQLAHDRGVKSPVLDAVFGAALTLGYSPRPHPHDAG